MKRQFGSRQHSNSRETLPEVGAVRHRNSAAQSFQPVLPPRLLPQELQRYDSLDVMLRPFVRDELAGPLPNRLPENLLFRSIHGIPSAVSPEALRAQPR